MKVAIVDMGFNERDRFGNTEKNICELSNSLVQEGHEVLVIYRNHIHGDYLFPLNTRVIKKCISDDSADLPGFMKFKREILRIFSAEKARKMTRAFKRDAYGSALFHELNSFKPDMIIFDSFSDASLLGSFKTTNRILSLNQACANLHNENGRRSTKKDGNSVINDISKKINELQDSLSVGKLNNQNMLAHAG
jgi:hypothetical protein